MENELFDCDYVLIIKMFKTKIKSEQEQNQAAIKNYKQQIL